MAKPEKFTLQQGMVTLEVVCENTVVSVCVTTPDDMWGDEDVTCLELSARNCLILADVLSESAGYILANKQKEQEITYALSI